MKKVLPKIIPPGKIRKTIDMISGKKDLVLMADGKLVTKVLRNQFSGDVDLFGHETEPNILELKNSLRSNWTSSVMWWKISQIQLQKTSSVQY